MLLLIFILHKTHTTFILIRIFLKKINLPSISFGNCVPMHELIEYQINHESNPSIIIRELTIEILK